MTRLHDGRLRRWMLQWAVVSMLLVQSIGWLHGVMHRPLRPATAIGVSLQVTGADAPAKATATAKAFGHERDSLDCRLFDLLGHADLLQGDATALPCDTATAPVAVHAPAGHAPGFERHYGARGPPAAA